MGTTPWRAELRAEIERCCPIGTELRTQATGSPNWVVDVADDGIWVHTEKSKREGEPQLLPGWMLQMAWDHLVEYESLTNGYLVRTDGLNVKRSSAICALLAALPDVDVVSTGPVTLVRRPRPDRP